MAVVTMLLESGVIDMSGVVSSILNTYAQALQTYEQQVTGDPEALAGAAEQQQDEAKSLGEVGSSLDQQAGGLKSSWTGNAADAFAAAEGALTQQLQQAAQQLTQEAQRLSSASTALEEAKSQVDNVVAQFQQKSQTLINEAHQCPLNGVQAYVQAANELGQSAIEAAKKAAEELAEQLAQLFGLPKPQEEESEKPKAPNATNGEQKGLLASLLSNPTVQKIYKAITGKDLEPEDATSFGKLGKLASQQEEWEKEDKGETGASTLKQNLAKSTTLKLGETGVNTLSDGSTTTNLDANTTLTTGPKVTDQGELAVEGGQLKGTGDLRANVVDLQYNNGANHLDVNSGADLKGSIGANSDGVTLSGDARVNVVDVNGSTQQSLGGVVNNTVSGDAYLGADAQGKVSATLDHGVIAQGSAFAGVQGTVQDSVSAGGFTLNGSLTGQAGAGAAGDAHMTYDNGHFSVGLNGSAALGLGGGAGVNLDVDVPKVEGEIGSAATWVGNTVSSAASSLGQTMMNNPYYLGM
jgi:uncharacterized protein YukE